MIVVVAPYDHSEVTVAALRLCEHVIGRGLDVTYIVFGNNQSKVHKHWDNRVMRKAQAKKLMAVLARTTTVVHFGCSPTFLRWLKHFDTKAERSQHVLVPLRYQVYRGDQSVYAEYDRIVCTSGSHKRVLDKTLGHAKAKNFVTWCTWDLGRVSIRRRGSVVPDKIKALVYCDSGTVDHVGSMVVSMVAYTVSQNHNLDITLAHTKSWSKHDNSMMKRLKTIVAADRVQSVRLRSFYQLGQLLSRNDWTIIPGVRSNFGLAATTALACGTPVICHNVSPFSDVVTPENGVLLPCVGPTPNAKAPVAKPDTTTWHEGCKDILADTTKLFALQRNDWKTDELYSTFSRTWDRVLVP